MVCFVKHESVRTAVPHPVAFVYPSGSADESIWRGEMKTTTRHCNCKQSNNSITTNDRRRNTIYLTVHNIRQVAAGEFMGTRVNAFGLGNFTARKICVYLCGYVHFATDHKETIIVYGSEVLTGPRGARFPSTRLTDSRVHRLRLEPSQSPQWPPKRVFLIWSTMV